MQVRTRVDRPISSPDRGTRRVFLRAGPKRRVCAALLALGTFALLFPGTTRVQALEIKLASVAPESSPFGTALNQIAADWERLSNGRIQVRVYHNGIAGAQSDVLRKMRIGQLQGGVFTSTGLAPVTNKALVVSVPFLIRNDAELQFVLDHITPTLDKAVEQSGMEAVAWVPSGWVRFFSRDPIRVPADLKAQKVGVSPEEPELYQAFKLLGYRPVSLGITDTLNGLNSGLADCILTSPLAVAGYQWFGVADYMLNVNIAPFLGAIILNAQTWAQIPTDLRPTLKSEVQTVTGNLVVQLESLEQKAIDTMQQYGLHSVSISDDQRRQWSQEFTRSYPALVGTAFDADMFKSIQDLLKQFRNP